MVRQFLRSSRMGISQITWNGSMRRFACLEAIRQFCLGKLGRQGGEIDFADARSAPLDTPSCAHNLDLSLCVGIACGKADLGEKKTLTSTANQVVHSCRNGPLIPSAPSSPPLMQLELRPYDLVDVADHDQRHTAPPAVDGD